MERMNEVEEMLREMSEKYKNSKSVEVYEEQLEGWFKIIDDLREENKKLKSDLSECECSMHFENDEVGYRKRECKKLKEELKYYKEKSEYLNKVIVKYQEKD